MGFRFQKRIRIFKGLTLNLSKSGASWSIGGRGMTLNVRKGRVTSTVGIPGTGLSYRKTLDTHVPSAPPQARTPEAPTEIRDPQAPRSGSATLLLLLVFFGVLVMFLLSNAH